MYLGQLEEVFRYSIPKGKSLAGFFAESIQGVGGSVQFPKGYLKKAFEKVRDLGGLCISDEAIVTNKLVTIAYREKNLCNYVYRSKQALVGPATTSGASRVMMSSPTL